MLVRPQSRSSSALSAIIITGILIFAPGAASANPLDEQACQRLRTERQALMVLGIDKQVEKGASWAKERLTVADLNLVKRYLDVYEQIKFRCEKVVALIEPDEKDDDDDDKADASPPMPERKGSPAVKSSAAVPATPPVGAAPAKPNSAAKSNAAAKGTKATLGATNASAVPAR